MFLLVMPALGSLVLAVLLILHDPTPETVHCDRAAQTCTYFFPSFGAGDTYTNALSDWTSSSVVHYKKGGASWKVERREGPLWLGSQRGDQATMDLYAKLSADLQAFLDDPKRPTFDATLPPSKVTYVGFAFTLTFGLLLGFFGFRWWRGWYAELEHDPAARAIVIHRRPMFFTGPRTVTYAASDLRLVELVEKRAIGRGQRAKFARFELRDARGKRVFHYTTLYDNKSRAKLEGDMSLLQSWFAQSS